MDGPEANSQRQLLLHTFWGEAEVSAGQQAAPALAMPGFVLQGRVGLGAGQAAVQAKAKRQRLPDCVWEMQAKEQTSTSTASRPEGGALPFSLVSDESLWKLSWGRLGTNQSKCCKKLRRIQHLIEAWTKAKAMARAHTRAEPSSQNSSPVRTSQKEIPALTVTPCWEQGQ